MKNLHKYAIFLVITFFVIINSTFILDQRQSAIILQFGEEKRTIKESGLQFKVPFIQNVVIFEKRILDLAIDEQEVIALDQKRLIIDAFTKYKIVNPLQFYVSVQNKDNAEKRLGAIFDSSLRQIIGEFPLHDLLSDKRSVIMSKIKEILAKESKTFGIEIIDVRIVRGNLPKENSEAIYRRMQTAREKEAREIRAEGFEKATRIKAKSDREVVVILSEADKKSNILKGQGEAVSNKIFAKAFSKDPEFFDFYRSMKAYEIAIQSENSSVIVSPNNEFFKYFSK
ncbi:MAG: membrane protease subunit HflC [Ulvibacter sp.]|jgi:membrane protease subunit HflC